jgi:hypothetical protein
LIQEGSTKLSSVPSGGGAAAASTTASGGVAPAASEAAPAEEEKKEEPAEESDEDVFPSHLTMLTTFLDGLRVVRLEKSEFRISSTILK